MAKWSVTHEIGTSAESNAGPTESDRLVDIKNLDGTNGVWVAVSDGVTAAAEADNCVFVGPGERVIFRWRETWSMIAISSAVKVNITTGMDRG